MPRDPSDLEKQIDQISTENDYLEKQVQEARQAQALQAYRERLRVEQELAEQRRKDVEDRFETEKREIERQAEIRR